MREQQLKFYFTYNFNIFTRTRVNFRFNKIIAVKLLTKKLIYGDF